MITSILGLGFALAWTLCNTCLAQVWVESRPRALAGAMGGSPEIEVFLRASDCPTLKTEVAALQAWKHARDGKELTLEVDCRQSPAPHEISIQALLPAKAASLHGQRARCEGPNCWNAALHESGVLSHIMHTNGDQFKSLLNTHCHLRKAEEGEVPQPGDVAAIRKKQQGGQWSEVHGFIYIGQTAFSKNDMGSASPWLLRPIETEYTNYGYSHDKACLNPSLTALPADCTTFVSFYRCDREFKLDNELGREDPELAALNMTVAACARHGSGSPESVSLTGLKKVNALLNAVRSTSPVLTPWANSLAQQFELSGAYFHQKKQSQELSLSAPAGGGSDSSSFRPPTLKVVINSNDNDQLENYLNLHPDTTPAIALDEAVKAQNITAIRWLMKTKNAKPQVEGTPVPNDKIDLYLNHLGVAEGEQRRAVKLIIIKGQLGK